MLAVATVRGLERHISATDGMHNHEMKKIPLDLIEVIQSLLPYVRRITVNMIADSGTSILILKY